MFKNLSSPFLGLQTSREAIFEFSRTFFKVSKNDQVFFWGPEARVSCQRSYGAREHKIPPKNFNHFFSGSQLVKTSKSIVILSSRVSDRHIELESFYLSFNSFFGVWKSNCHIKLESFTCSRICQVIFEGSKRPETLY